MYLEEYLYCHNTVKKDLEMRAVLLWTDGVKKLVGFGNVSHLKGKRKD